MKKAVISVYCIMVALFSVFLTPLKLKVASGSTLNNVFRPIFWKPVWDDAYFKFPYRYDIDILRYIICLLVITAIFAIVYLLSSDKKKDDNNG